VIGLDDHSESAALARPRLESVGGQFLECSLLDVDLPDGCASVTTALDVLEHLDDDAAAFKEMVRITRRGGLIVVTVPALMLLWSDWDVVLHHRRRYHRPDLRKLLDVPGVELLRLAYINTFALAPVLLVRGLRRFFPPKSDSQRMEHQIPPEPLNSLLYAAFVGPGCWGWFKPPAGVSLLAVLRRV
jgi:SAM-dependent methyltransferase